MQQAPPPQRFSPQQTPPRRFVPQQSVRQPPQRFVPQQQSQFTQPQMSPQQFVPQRLPPQSFAQPQRFNILPAQSAVVIQQVDTAPQNFQPQQRSFIASQTAQRFPANRPPPPQQVRPFVASTMLGPITQGVPVSAIFGPPTAT